MHAKRKPRPAVRRRARSAAGTGASLNFTALVDSIRQVHEHCVAQANRAVNVSLTLRNWAIGWYLREYEQQGSDRAKYGEALVDRLAEALEAQGLNDLASRTLRQCRQFYAIYPMIWQTASAKSVARLLPASIWRSLSAKSPAALDMPIRESSTPELAVPVEKLFTRLSFSHLAELIAIPDPLKRAFYEIECIRGNWSVRALKRQIATLYFERSGLSTHKEKLAALAHAAAESATCSSISRWTSSVTNTWASSTPTWPGTAST